MTIYTDLSNRNLTKTAKYLFLIEQCLYHPVELQDAFQKLEPTLSESFNPVNAFIGDLTNPDYNVESELKEENPELLFFITCDTRNPRFLAQLNIIKRHQGYVDCYQYDNHESNTAVIRYKVFIKERVRKLLESKYSEMYHEREYQSIANNRIIQQMFSKFNYETKKNEFDRIIHVLIHSDEGFNSIIDELGITDTDTINALMSNEFDSKFSINEESLTYGHPKIQRYEQVQ